MRDSIRLQDPDAGESRYINRADDDDFYSMDWVV